MNNSYNPIPEFASMMESIGCPIYSDEFTAQLMAWFHCVGGNNEAVVLNMALNGALRACAAKMKIEGGSIPDPRLIELWRERVRELATAIREKSGFPEWIIMICERYDLKLPRESIDFIENDIRFWIAAPESRIP